MNPAATNSSRPASRAAAPAAIVATQPPVFCTCGEPEPHVIAHRLTYDGIGVNLWSDGAITGVLGLKLRGVPIRRPKTKEDADRLRKAGWLALGEVCIRKVDELPALLKAADRAARIDNMPGTLRRLMAEAKRQSSPKRAASAGDRRAPRQDEQQGVTGMNALTAQPKNEALTATRYNVLTAALEAIGWEMSHTDLDMVAGTIKIEAKRFDGRVVRAFATSTSSYVESEGVRVRHIKLRGLPIDRVERVFLSRQRCRDPHHAVMQWCHYLTDNPMPGLPALSRVDVRLLVEQILLGAP